MKTDNTPAVKIPDELAKIESAGIEMSKAQAIASNYTPFFAQAQEYAELLKALDSKDPEYLTKVKRIRLDLGKLCSTLGTQKDDDKAIIKIEDRYIMGLYNAVKEYLKILESKV